MKQIQNLWSGLDARRRLIAILSAAAIFVAVLGIGRIASTPSMALLYSGLDASASGEVIAALEADGVAFEVRDTSILVEESARDRIRMAMAARDLPAGGAAGYEILDGLSGFGTTSQMFDAAYWRAREGELARTITGSPDIRAARVHLANPDSQPFSRDPGGSASVTVTMARGRLGPSQAEAIRYLVSSAVAGFEPSSVAVLDAVHGVILAGEDASETNAAILNTDDREAVLRANIERLLEARVGPGRAVVEVSVDANMDSQTVTERLIDPASRVVISSETEESKESAEGSTPGVTVASNLPDGEAGGLGDSNRSTSLISERQNFEVSETTTERVILPGQIERISVAVMVDGIMKDAPDGAGEIWSPRTEEELDVLRLLVQSVIGFDMERGDTVTIQSLQFSALPEQGTYSEPPDAGFLARHGAQLAQIGALVLIVLALVMLVLRPMLGRKPDVLPAELAGPDGWAGGPAGRIGTGADQSGMLDASAQSGARIERLRDVIASRGEDSAAVFRKWIEAPETSKEPAGS